MSKVTVVGSGNVGATVANVLAHQNIVNEIVLLDLMADMAKGKALDTWQQAIPHESQAQEIMRSQRALISL